MVILNLLTCHICFKSEDCTTLSQTHEIKAIPAKSHRIDLAQVPSQSSLHLPWPRHLSPSTKFTYLAQQKMVSCFKTLFHPSSSKYLLESDIQ